MKQNGISSCWPYKTSPPLRAVVLYSSLNELFTIMSLYRAIGMQPNFLSKAASSALRCQILYNVARQYRRLRTEVFLLAKTSTI